jgi:hypothetical protein
MNKRITQLVEVMTLFASNAKDDRMSVIVARTAQRLAHQGEVCERPLTDSELRIIKMFADRIPA